MLKIKVPSDMSSRITGVLSSDKLNEIRSAELIDLAKQTNRYNIITSGISVAKINYDELLSKKTDDLDIYFKVKEYTVVIRFVAFVPKLRWFYSELLRKTNSDDLSKNQMKFIITKSLVNSLDTCDVNIRCSCPDFQYRFAYVATVGKYILGDPETRPAVRTNPSNKGSMCKHLSSILGRPSRWQKRIVNELYKLLAYDMSLLDDK